jgi:hypothetical protein
MLGCPCAGNWMPCAALPAFAVNPRPSAPPRLRLPGLTSLRLARAANAIAKRTVHQERSCKVQ